MTNLSIEPSSNFVYQLGGSVPFDNKSYVTRAADQELYDLLKAREYCFVFNSRQMGKSSLRVRTMFKLRQDGIRCVVIDPQMRGKTIREDQWYAGTIKRLIEDLSLDKQVNFSQWWKELDAQDISVVERFNEFIDQILLRQIIDGDIIIFIEEVDNLLSLKFDTDSFFGLIRSWHERRAENPEYQRLTFAFFGVATPYDLIRDHKGSPFGLGHAIELNGFQFSEAKPLMDGLEGKVADPEAVLKEVLDWTGGQPFLTQKLLKLISREPVSTLSATELVRQVVQNKIITHWESQDVPPHLKTVRDRLLQSGDEQIKGYLLSLYQQILLEGSIVADESPEQMQLRLTGFVVKHDDRLTIYNQIYRRVFDQGWVKQEIDDLRDPLYAEHFRAWQNAKENEKNSFLLRKELLAKADEWAIRVRHLSEEDNYFLQKSREQVQQKIQAENNRQLEIECQAREKAEQNVEEATKKLRRAERKAKRREMMGWIFLSLVMKQAKKIQKRAEQKAKKKEISSLILFIGMITSVIVTVLWGKGESTKLGIEKEVSEAKTAYSEDKELDSLLHAVRAGKKYQDRGIVISMSGDDENLRSQILSSLLLSYGIREKNHFAGDISGIHSVIFSPEGKTIASGSGTGQIELWNSDGKLRYSFKGHNLRVTSVAFSPDGKTIASGSWDNTVKLWNLDGKFLKTLNHSSDVTSVAFSPDGKTIASGSRDKTVKLWNLDGKFLKPLNHSSGVISVAFSPDKKTIASLSDDKILKIWSINGKLLNFFKIDTTGSLIFSPNGKNFAIASNSISSTENNKQVRLVDLKGNLIQIFAGMKSAAFSPNGKTIVSGSNDNTGRLWSLDEKLSRNFPVQKFGVDHIRFKPDGSIISHSSDNILKLWNSEGQLLQTSNKLTDKVTSVVFSPDGKMIASIGLDKYVRLWNSEGQLLQTSNKLTDKVTSVVFSPDGKMIASSGLDKTIKLWDLNGKLLQTIKDKSVITNLAFSLDGKMLASGSKDYTVKLWKLDSKLSKLLGTYDSDITSLAFSPDGKMLASGSKDYTVKLWNLDSKTVQTIARHEKFVTSLVFSPDGNMLASGSRDNTVQIWRRLDSKSNFKLLSTLKGHTKYVNSVAFSPNSKVLASASGDGIVRLWYLDLDNLINNGCNWLHEYLASNPSIIEKDQLKKDQQMCKIDN
jgi:WD40 repeat protein